MRKEQRKWIQNQTPQNGMETELVQKQNENRKEQNRKLEQKQNKVRKKGKGIQQNQI